MNSEAVFRILVHVRTLVAAGQPMPEGLSALARRANLASDRILAAALSQEMAQGTALSTAVAKHVPGLPPLVHTLIRSGETGDMLPALDALIEFHQASRRLAKRLEAVTMYPRILLYMVMILVMPAIGYAGKTFNAALGITGNPISIILSAFEEHHYFEALIQILALPVFFFQQGWFGWLAMAVLGYLIFIWKDGPLSALTGRLARRLYLVGPCLKTALAAEFTTATGILLSNRIPLDQAVELAAGFSGDRITRMELAQVVEDLTRGTPLSESLTRHPLFPETLSWFVAVGELSGDMARCLGEAGRFYRGEAEHLTEVLSQSLEPVLLILVGVLLAPLLISIVLPLFKLMQSF